jgi:uncharacterized damage-inducible protein DinB
MVQTLVSTIAEIIKLPIDAVGLMSEKFETAWIVSICLKKIFPDASLNFYLRKKEDIILNLIKFDFYSVYLMQTEINRIHQLLISTFNGDPWHGSAVMYILSGITAQQAIAQPFANNHHIWGLALHMVAWRKFTLEKLRGNAAYSISTPEQDWPAVAQTDEQAWQQTLQDLRQSQQALLETIQRLDDEWLDKVVPGKSYTFYVLLHGIIQHDLYHSGQIALLKKQFL